MDSIYKEHINTVLHYIDLMIQKNWINEEQKAFNNALSIHKLAQIANMSDRNFQVIFTTTMNENPHQYITRLRIEHVMNLLKDNKMSMPEISDYVGFANQQALYNAMRKKAHATPSQTKVNLLQKSETYPLVIPPYKITNTSQKRIIYISYIGNYDTCNSPVFEEDTWDKLYSFAKSNNILPPTEEYWGICFDDTDITDSAKCRFYACMTITSDKEITMSFTNPIKLMILPACKYAVYTHKGSYSLLNSFYGAILKQLPPRYKLGDGYILEHYLNSPTDTKEEDLLTEVFLPITYSAISKD